ncbi:hypothetical protein IRJ41_002655 [Triplophysa rosa]|uniref:Uncharacterized protein n=1 Tax=Triplophysa rosa TaxID=992332 RepID=A0A9W7WSB5_TRIRA|nr:hypothetical protein IRJ41_002655 [Triplophysa rosa]
MSSQFKYTCNPTISTKESSSHLNTSYQRVNIKTGLIQSQRNFSADKTATFEPNCVE